MSRFKDAEFMTAREKELVLAQWRRFVERGFNFEQFTDRLYKHLSLHASFIAHFDLRGFFATYFENPEATISFLRQFDRDHGCVSVEYGSTWWLEGDYADINGAMCEVVDTTKERLYSELTQKVRGRDLAIASQLLAKHGIRYLPPHSIERNQSSPLRHTTEQQQSSERR